MNLNPEASVKEADASESVRNKSQTVKLSASFYTGTFYGLMKKNKQNLKLKESD